MGVDAQYRVSTIPAGDTKDDGGNVPSLGTLRITTENHNAEQDINGQAVLSSTTSSALSSTSNATHSIDGKMAGWCQSWMNVSYRLQHARRAKMRDKIIPRMSCGAMKERSGCPVSPHCTTSHSPSTLYSRSRIGVKIRGMKNRTTPATHNVMAICPGFAAKSCSVCWKEYDSVNGHFGGIGARPAPDAMKIPQCSSPERVISYHLGSALDKPGRRRTVVTVERT